MVVIASQLVARVSTEGVQEVKITLEQVGKEAEKTQERFKGLKDALSTAAGFAIFGAGMAGFGFLKDQIGSVIDLTKEFQLTADTRPIRS